MTKLILHLPFSRKLELKLTKSRLDGSLDKSLIPSLKELKNVRAGNRLSRLFRHIFEHKSIKKILGGNIAFAIVAVSALPGSASAITIPEQTSVIIRASETPLTTNIEGGRSPVKGLKVTQGFRFYHQGVDLDGQTGDEVRTIKAGSVLTVISSGFSYGNHVIVDHGNGVTSLYAHLSKILVRQGDQMSADQLVGLMGSTGRSTGSHLHLEVRVNGKAVDPLKIIQ